MATVEADRGLPHGGTQSEAYAQRLKYTRRSLEKLRRNAPDVYLEKEGSVSVKLT